MGLGGSVFGAVDEAVLVALIILGDGAGRKLKLLEEKGCAGGGVVVLVAVCDSGVRSKWRVRCGTDSGIGDDEWNYSSGMDLLYAFSCILVEP